MTQNVDIRIARNSLFNIARTVASIPVLLALTPYIIHRIGGEAFGVWALVGVISSYAQLGDFGITESLIRFIAEFKARDESASINRIINTALTLYLVLAGMFFLLFMRFLPLVIRDVLAVPVRLEGEVSYVFTLSLVLFFANMGFSVFNSLIVGFERFDLSNLVALGSILLTAAGTVFFLSHGYGLAGLVYTNIVVTAVVAVSNVAICRSLFPEMRLNPFRHFDRATFRHIFSFSWKVQVSNVTNLMIFQLDRVIISHYVGIAAVGYYEVATRVASPARAFIASIFTPMIPAASGLSASASDDLVAGLYRRSFKYMCMAALPCLVFIAALAHPFLEAWMGAGYEVSAYTLQCLAIVYLCNLLTGPGSFLLNGINKPQLSMQASILAATLNIALCIVLVRWIGYYGVVIAIALATFLSSLYFIFLLHRNVPGLAYATYPSSLGRPILASLTGGALAAFTEWLWITPSYLSLMVAGATGTALAVAILAAGKYLDDYDRRTFMTLIPFGRNRR